MGTTWPTEALVQAVREALGRPSVSRNGFQLDAAALADRELVVTFRWRQDPNRYVLRFELPEGDQPESPWTGLPVDTPDEWAHELAGLLTEELDTGAVRRARRRPSNGVVELDLHDEPSHPCPPGYYSSHVLLPTSQWTPALRADFGHQLASAGQDVDTPRRQYRAGRLVSWRMLNTNSATPKPVGHAAVAWHPTLPATATLDVLELRIDLVAAAVYLARMSVHDAAEAGARWVQATCSHPQLPQAGFRRADPDGPLTLDTTALD